MSSDADADTVHDEIDANERKVIERAKGLLMEQKKLEVVEKLKQKQTEAGFIELIRDSDEFEVFVRTTESLDKEALIAERRKWGVGETDHTVHFDSQLAALGVRIVSKEKIVIDVATEPEVKP